MEEMSKSVYYFAYGSNLLTKRIHIKNPKAIRLDTGRLEKYKLDFVGYGEFWKGAPATIIPDVESQTWGVIWQLPVDQIKNLDDQEGVDNGEYIVLNVNVVNPAGKVYNCRVYQHSLPIDEICPLCELPEARRPSLIYLKTIVKGALESRLPLEYVQALKSIKHNGYTHENDIIGQEVRDIQIEPPM